MGDEPEFYRSYLLRIRRTGSADAPIWRLLLEDVLSRERCGFSSLEQLVRFLQEQAGMRSSPASPEELQHQDALISDREEGADQ
jgi:hypothetical protein